MSLRDMRVAVTDPGPASARSLDPVTVGPLSHIRVLDFTALVQGPLATQLLGDFGADVIKFERPGGEWGRSWGILNGQSHGEMDSFLAFNRNKRSVAVDLKDPKARERIVALAPDADVVVENFRPGVMERLGLGYEEFRQVNPQIVYASSSGYGQTGPYRGRPGQDMLIQGLSGIMFLTGRSSDPPTACGIGIADQYAALHIVIAVLAALEHRSQTGVGQRVEVDLLSCLIAAQQQELTYYFAHGRIPERGAHNYGSVWATAPFGIYETSDGRITVAMTPCPVLAEALDFPWLSQFTELQQMVDFRDEIYERLAEVFRQNTTAHWIEVLLAHDVWCGEVKDYEAMINDPQVRHRDMFWDVEVGEGDGRFRTPGSPIRFSQTPARLRRGVPRLGQHNHDVLGNGDT